MPGLLVLRPVAGSAKADKIKNSTVTKIQDKAHTEKMPTARFSSISAKVMPLPPSECHDTTAARSSSIASQTRPKQVTDPLGESVKARICDSKVTHGLQRFSSNASSSSGSEHEPSTVCLAAMVTDFIEDDAELPTCGRVRCNCEYGTCDGCVVHDEDEDDTCNAGDIADVLQGLSQPAGGFESKLLLDVLSAVRIVRAGTDVCTTAEGGQCTGSCLRRAVMTHLRVTGYNAAVCKSRWDHSRGFPGGDYEYIDVIGESSKDRTFVDLDFRGQFEIARPTHHHNAALAAIPSIFVGRQDRLQRVIDMMTDATRRSLKRRSMHLPPWRKPEYMRAKWLAPYKRTTNEYSQAGPAPGCRIYAVVNAVSGQVRGPHKQGGGPKSSRELDGKVETPRPTLEFRPRATVASRERRKRSGLDLWSRSGMPRVSEESRTEKEVLRQ